MDAGINHVRLDGDMTSSKRQESINSFQEDEDVKVFLVSLKAGGAGLNLTRWEISKSHCGTWPLSTG